ncbi:hypothetical protein BGZ96_000588 [Linnemannia gamsii]|uniref:Uncharacterized protein n=1 Tax=Linnemannia gamsii TaxID=64522 RepID=A0ABQ7JP59_9FUNG|nr:hypothetical protein BGZ96_000588 [Linnemannia gamsii]
MVDDEQSWGDIEALAGEEAFDRYYSFLDPGLVEFWRQDKIEQLNDAVIDQVGRFLKPRAATILKGNYQQWLSKYNTTTIGGCEDTNSNSEGDDIRKLATIYPVVVASAWMDLFRWEKVARSVCSSPLVCQHIWDTFGDGRPFTEEEQPYLDEIKALAIENGARISTIKAARIEARKAKIAQEERERLEADRLEAARLQAAKEDAERIEAARIKAVQDEADRREAERLETEKIEAKRVEANKTKAMKRKAKADALREEDEGEAKAWKPVTRKKEYSRTRAAHQLTARQQKIVMQENIALEEAAKEERAKQEAAKNAFGTNKAKRETAMAAAKAWATAVREGAARKAELQSVAIKRQRNASSGQAGLNRGRDLPLNPGSIMGSKRKIGNMEVFLPPTTFAASSTTPTADQENCPPQKDINSPPTLRASVSSTSCTSLISPALTPLDESLDFQLSKRTRRSSPEILSGPTFTSTVTTTLTPTTAIQSTANTGFRATPVSVYIDTATPKTLPSLSLPPTSLFKDAELPERIQKLMAMKQVLTDRAQSIEIQRQDQQIEADLLLQQRDAAIEAAKARQRGDNNTSGYNEKNKAGTSQVPPEDLTLASSRASQESTPAPPGLPSPITPNQPPQSLSPQLATADPNAAPHVIDLTDDADDEQGIANQKHAEVQMRLEAVNQWRQRKQNWQKRVQEIQQQLKVLGPKLAEYRQQTQQFQQTIFNEQQQWQQLPGVTPEQAKQLHKTQRIQLATSQQQQYLALQYIPAAQRAAAMVHLNRRCQNEAQALMAQQKDVEEKVAQFLHRQEASKKAIPWLQLQLENAQETEKAFMKEFEALQAQKHEQERQRLVLLQEHQTLQQLQMISAPSSSLSPPQGPVVGQGSIPLNSVTSQLDRQLKEKRAMDEHVLQQLSQQRDLQRKTQLQQQLDLQQTQKKALISKARTLAEVHVQGITQAISQGQRWSEAQAQVQHAQSQAQSQQEQHAQAQQKQTQTAAVQEQQARMNGQPTMISPTVEVSLNQPSAANTSSLPPKSVSGVQDPAQSQSVSQPQAAVSAQRQQLIPTPQPAQSVTPGSTSTSAAPALVPGQQPQPSPESTVTESSKLAVIFPFPNPMYDITEWTAEDKNRLWTTWLEVGDDWEQISTKGLQGKFSIEVCRAVIQGTAS